MQGEGCCVWDAVDIRKMGGRDLGQRKKSQQMLRNGIFKNGFGLRMVGIGPITDVAISPPAISEISRIKGNSTRIVDRKCAISQVTDGRTE